MTSHGLKSDTKHPYQKSMHPFWRFTPSGMYSEETKEVLERKKLDYDGKARYISWQTKTT